MEIPVRDAIRRVSSTGFLLYSFKYLSYLRPGEF